MSAQIWIVNQFANTPDVPGGTRQFELAQHLVARGMETSVFSSDYNLSARRYLKLKAGEILLRENVAGVDWNWLRASAYQKNDWRRIVNMLSFCLSFFCIGLFRKSPRLIIGSSPQIFAAFTAWLLARVKGARFFFEVRDLWPQVLIDLGGKSPRSLEVRVVGWVERFLYRRSDHVIVLAEGAIEHVVQKGARPDRVSWLPNSVQIELFDIDLSVVQAKEQFSIDPLRFALMYTGAHGLANSLDTIVEAAALLDRSDPGRFQILLVGDGTHKNGLQEKARGLKSIEFRDPVKKLQIPALLRAADALILTLRDVPLFRYGVSPNKLYDYYGAGKAVVVAVGGSINEEVERERIGATAPPENPEALADAIRRVAAEALSERLAMGQRAREVARSIYSREAVATRLVQLIEMDLKK